MNLYGRISLLRRVLYICSTQTILTCIHIYYVCKYIRIYTRKTYTDLQTPRANFHLKCVWYAYLCIYHRQKRSGDKSLRSPGCFGPNLRFLWFSVAQWDQAYIQIRTVTIILFPSAVSGVIKHIYTLVIFMHYVYVYMYKLHGIYICVYRYMYKHIYKYIYIYVCTSIYTNMLVLPARYGDQLLEQD